MFLSVYLLLQLVALACLVLSFKKDLYGGRSYLITFIGLVLFLYLGLGSFNIQTENCDNVVINQTVTGDVTVFENSYSCNINVYQDRIQAYFNIGMAFLSLIYGFSMIVITKAKG